MKKFLEIATGKGCLILMGLVFLIRIVIVTITDSDIEKDTDIQETSTTQESNITLIAVDSVELLRQERYNDSVAAVNKLKREKAIADLSKFRKKVDEFEGTTFYSDRRTPYYANVNFIYPYIGKMDDQYWLRLRFQYAADDWLFINRCQILVDGDKHVVTGEWNHDNNSKIWEWLDIKAGSSELLLLEQIANSKSAKVRYTGDQYYKDRTITNKEKSVIKKTLDIYNRLSNNMTYLIGD